jgi:hypothetical protein
MKLPGLDKIKKIVQADGNSGKEADALPKTQSSVTIPPFNPGDQEKTLAVPVKKPPYKSPSFIDQISSFFVGTKKTGTKSKSSKKPLANKPTQASGSNNPVKPVVEKVPKAKSKGPSLIDTISGLLHPNK